MHRYISFGFAIALAMSAALSADNVATRIDNYAGKARLVVLSDIGNEPDDQMSLVRLLLYSNEIDIEALVATTSTWQKAKTQPETMHALVKAYAEVRPNLLLHASGWPEASALDANIYAGQSAYGMAATGIGKTSAGARALIRAADRDDARPLWVALWGGANTLAQALIEVRATRTPQELARFVEKLRVYSISDQDDAGAWVRREFPTLFYIVDPSTQDSAEYYYATWTGISGDVYYRNGAGADTSLVTNEWLDTNVRTKGALGKAYPKFWFIMEGDTPSFLALIDNGLAARARPDWGGWGGRYLYRVPRHETRAVWTTGGDEFARVTTQDTVRGIDGREYVSDQATIWRWRGAYQRDFAARMDWTIRDYAHANHAPRAVVNGDTTTAPIFVDATVGVPVMLDASQSKDPDAGALHYTWFHYAEAGAMDGNLAAVTIANADTARATVTATAVCRPRWLPMGPPCKGTGTAHVILVLTDNGTPQMTSYRRVVLTVHAAAQ